MKRYKLLKDLPFAKAGEIFKRHTFKGKDGLSDYDYFEICKLKNGEVNETAFGIKRNDFIDNLDDWFEEIDDETIEIDFTDGYHGIDYSVEEGWHTRSVSPDDNEEHYPEYLKDDKEVGLAFKSEKEAEKHLKWLKARAVLLGDTKGFKPDWSNRNQMKYCGYWCNFRKELRHNQNSSSQTEQIYFESAKDLKESFEAHQKEWKIYLGVE